MAHGPSRWFLFSTIEFDNFLTQNELLVWSVTCTEALQVWQQEGPGQFMLGLLRSQVQVVPEVFRERVLARWHKLVRHLGRIRFRQRVWAYLGQHLQTISKPIREQLKALFPIGH